MPPRKENSRIPEPRRGNRAVVQGASPGKRTAHQTEPRRGGTTVEAGYSGTPLAQKLGIKPNHTILISGQAPKTFAPSLDLPEGATIASATKSANVIIHFTTSGADLRKHFSKLAKHLDNAGGLWISWPKKTSGVPTDLNENIVREIGLAAGLVDNKVCAIDHTWSGLRFVYRLKDR